MRTTANGYSAVGTARVREAKNSGRVIDMRTAWRNRVGGYGSAARPRKGRQFGGYVGVVQDVTERVNRDAELRRSEERSAR